jgi:hypothetical protein
MTDLDRRFRALDLLEAPNVSDDVERRSRLPDPAVPPERPMRRVVAATVALGLFAALIVFIWSTVRDPKPAPDIVDTSTPPPSMWVGVGEGLTELPPPPALRQATVWTGRYLVMWGGNGGTGDPPHFDDGWLLDAMTSTWSRMPPSPLSGRSQPAVAWTGTEVLIWGGWSGTDRGEPLASGAAFDPGTGDWRTLPDPPGDWDGLVASVWTGRELIVIGESQAMALDPVAGTWRLLPPPPLAFEDADGMWTGREVLVFGARIGEGPYGPPLADGIAFDPGANAWRPLPPLNLPDWRGYPSNGIDANAQTAVWDGNSMVAMDYGLRVAAYEPTSDSWSPLPPLPVNSCEDTPRSAAAMGTVMTRLCGELIALAPDADRWTVVLGRGQDGPIASRFGYSLEPVAANDIFVLLGFPYGGGDDRPIAWAYRPSPPSPVATAEDVWDVAAAFAALRSGYPNDPDVVPPEVQANLEKLLSPSGLEAYEQRDLSGVHRLWAYYYGFEVVRVDGTAPPFSAVVRFSADENFSERLTIGPGLGLDGIERDLVILDAEGIEASQGG